MANNPSSRIKELQTGNPEKLEVVLTVECKDRASARDLERFLHQSLSGINILGEWFSLSKNNLYKVLKRLSIDPECKVVSEFNLKPANKVAGGSRDKNKEKMMRGMELALSKRRKQVTILVDKLAEFGVSHKDSAAMIDFSC